MRAGRHVCAAALAPLLGALATTAPGIARPQSAPPPWQSDALKAVARVVSEHCSGQCGGRNATRRVGTGFLARLPAFGSDPVLITALHVVAGSNLITADFTESDTHRPTVATVLGVDKGADVVVLGLSSLPEAHPLVLGERDSNDWTATVYGYAEGGQALISDQGKIKLKGVSHLSQLPGFSRWSAQIDELGYPDKDLLIVSTENMMQPGHSGAPVFSPSGKVIGMAHGGIRGAGSQWSWMIPTERLVQAKRDPVDVATLKAMTIQNAFAAKNAFWGDQGRRRISSRVGAAFFLEWPATDPLFQSYARRLDRSVARDRAWLTSGARDVLSQGRLIRTDEAAFPASTSATLDPECKRIPPPPGCTDAQTSEVELLQVLDSLVVRIACYRAGDFEAWLGKGAALSQPALALELPPVEALAERVRRRELEWSYDWNGSAPARLFLGSRGFVEYAHGSGRFTLHPDVTDLEDLYGGACRLNLQASEPRYQPATRRLERLLRFGGACIHLKLTADTNTPVAFTAYVPPINAAGGGFWGMLPLFYNAGTTDDTACY